MYQLGANIHREWESISIYGHPTFNMMIQDRSGRFQYIPSTMVGAVPWHHGSVWCSTVVRLPEVTWYKTEARSEATHFEIICCLRWII